MKNKYASKVILEIEVTAWNEISAYSKFRSGLNTLAMHGVTTKVLVQPDFSTPPVIEEENA